MKKIVAIIIVLTSLTFVTFAKKDINAWKQENSLENQYRVFKENLNFWNGNYFLDDNQLEDFYGALADTISGLEQQVSQGLTKIDEQKQELKAKQALIDETQQKLDESKKLQDSITVLGLNINKTVYSTFMYLFIIGVLVLAGFIYLLYKRGHKVTRETKKEFEELKAEYEEHKKQALDRYTKINMELHKTRMELQRK
jgi:F0F1-type ATP synthase membrane subunit b/b'